MALKYTKSFHSSRNRSASLRRRLRPTFWSFLKSTVARQVLIGPVTEAMTGAGRGLSGTTTGAEAMMDEGL